MNQFSSEELQSLSTASRQSTSCSTCFHRRRCAIADAAPPLPLRQYPFERAHTLAAASAPARIRVVHSGAFKSRVWTRHGHECILDFFEGGDVLGLHGLSGTLQAQIVALEPGQLCELDAAALPHWESLLAPLAARLRAEFEEQLDRACSLHVSFGVLPVRERLARFLVELSRRQRRRGLRGDALLLRMSREDIGNHLGARLETVSREFSALRRAGLIELNRRDLRILDAAALARLCGDAGALR